MTLKQIMNRVPENYWDEEIVFDNGEEFMFLYEHNINIINGIIEFKLIKDLELDEEINMN